MAASDPRIVVPTLSRRELLAFTGGLAASFVSANAESPFGFGGASRVVAQDKSAGDEPLSRFPRMVHEWFVSQVKAAEQRGLAIKNNLRTQADAEAYVRDVRKRIATAFGPFPEKTPLNPKVTRVTERETYRIENVIFESRPEFYVTANLYVPKGFQGPRPGVVGSCGHSSNGKAAEAYQSFAQGLCRLGYVVLIFDPIGQGERLQYVDEKWKPRRNIGVSEHLYAGNQQFLVGEFFGSWRAWDGIRALDYLLTRPEVDPKHVGITGNSGGGTMSTWLCGVEERWTMAAPSCFVTTFRRNLENELPADTEQCPPRALALGLDHDDFLAAMAPKPVIVLAKERDFFDVRGSQEAFDRLKKLYTLLGKPDNVSLFVGPTDHGYSQENREAMYRWFHRATGAGAVEAEPKITVETDATLQCTPSGQVAELASRNVFAFTRELAQGQVRQRRQRHTIESLGQAVAHSLRLPKREKAPDYRILRPIGPRGYPLATGSNYAVETEPGVFAIVTQLHALRHMSRPPRGQGKAILYVSHHSADAELRSEPLVRELMASEKETPFFACDVRGIGDSRPNTCGVDQFLRPYGNDYFYAIHSIMLDRPYVGQKTHDVLSVLDWLADHGYTEVHLAALQWGTLPAAFAALLSQHVTKVTLKQALTSYEAIATQEEYDWPLSTFVPGPLTQFDLPQVYEALRSKQLTQLEPRGPAKKA